MNIIRTKQGMPVMALRNIDINNGIANGTRLIIKNVRKHVLHCIIMNGNHAGEEYFLFRCKLKVDHYSLGFVFWRIQFPIRMCYGMSINKSQGQSVMVVGVFLPDPVFAHGQLYVAVSRGKSFERIHIFIKQGKNQWIDAADN